MSLVISELSSHGIVMVGDTSLIDDAGLHKKRLTTKVQYFPEAKVGITCWGLGGVDGDYLDEFLASFIAEVDTPDADIEDLANILSARVNSWFDDHGIPPKYRIGGIHIGGYQGGEPKLWHIHRKDEGANPHIFELFRDWPESKDMSQEDLNSHLRNGQVYIFNGKHRYCKIALESLELSRRLLYRLQGASFPEDSIDGRISFVKHLLRTVAVMHFSTMHAIEVSESMVFLAFDRKGLVTRAFARTSEIERMDSSVFLVEEFGP